MRELLIFAMGIASMYLLKDIRNKYIRGVLLILLGYLTSILLGG